jgi:hypothetical protein
MINSCLTGPANVSYRLFVVAIEGSTAIIEFGPGMQAKEMRNSNPIRTTAERYFDRT